MMTVSLFVGCCCCRCRFLASTKTNYKRGAAAAEASSSAAAAKVVVPFRPQSGFRPEVTEIRSARVGPSFVHRLGERPIFARLKSGEKRETCF